jgi:hypothetical protein
MNFMVWLLKCPALYHAVYVHNGCDGVRVPDSRRSGDHFSGFIIYREVFFNEVLISIPVHHPEFEVGEISQNLYDEKGGEAGLRRTMTGSSSPQDLMTFRNSKNRYAALLVFRVLLNPQEKKRFNWYRP